jgi:hypothetical protein
MIGWVTSGVDRLVTSIWRCRYNVSAQTDCEADVVTLLILQIQEAALDSKASVTDALRKAKIACVKLGLADFGQWVDQELNGYMEMDVSNLPQYRKLHGRPEANNRYRGWQPIIFSSARQQTDVSFSPIGMAISAIEESIPKDETNRMGGFSFPYPPEMAHELRAAMNWADDLRIKLEISQILGIVSAVRNILLDWTIEMEKQGILGENLTFSSDDRQKSASLTAQTVNNINIGQVGSFVQSAQDTTVQGGIDSTMTLSHRAHDLVQQIEQLLPVSNLSPPVERDTRKALEELKQATNSASPDGGRIRTGLASLKRVLAPAGETLLKLAVDAAVKNILGTG